LISKLSDAEVMFSIGTLNEDERKTLESGASSISNRLNAMKKCTDIGIKTGVFFGPMYPTIKLTDISRIIDTFTSYGAKEIMVDKFNLKPGIFENLKKCGISNFERIKNESYFKEIFDEIQHICKQKNVKAVSAF